MCGGFLLFAGSRRRKQLVEIERQKELVAAIKQNANRGWANAQSTRKNW